VNVLYKENYKHLKKEIEDDYRRWKDLPCSWVGRINIVKMAVLPKAIYMFNEIPIKTPVTFITEAEKSTLKFIWKHKKTRIAKAILSQKSNAHSSYHNTLKLDPCLSPCTSINSKWIKDLNFRPETLKLLQEGAGNTLEAIGIGKDFFYRTPAAQQLRERMDKWG
jgi:hypothetical protein